MSIKGLLYMLEKLDESKKPSKKEQKTQNKTKKESPTDKIIKKAKTKNLLIVRTQSYSMGTMAATLLGSTSVTTNGNGSHYQIVTPSGEEQYVSNMEDTLLTDRDILTVYDMRNGKRKIGMVKQYLISVGVPLFEKETKKCTVTMDNEKLCNLKRCISFGNLQLETLDGKAKITIKSEGHYAIYYGRRKIADVHEIPIKLKNGFVDRYVIEYTEDGDQNTAVMMTIALDTVNT